MQRISLAIVAAAMLAFTVENAQAGLIRHVGRSIKGNSQRVTTPVADTGRAAVAGTQTVGQKTADAVGAGYHATQSGVNATANGAKAVGRGAAAAPGKVADGAKAAPGAVGQGIKSGASAIWHAIY